MDEFGYLSVLFSIILGLAITQILKGFRWHAAVAGPRAALDGGLPELQNLAFHIAFIATVAVAAMTRREWYHKVTVLVTAYLFGFYITLLFARLR